MLAELAQRLFTTGGLDDGIAEFQKRGRRRSPHPGIIFDEQYGSVAWTSVLPPALADGAASSVPVKRGR